jgi:hypothetical protein
VHRAKTACKSMDAQYPVAQKQASRLTCSG